MTKDFILKIKNELINLSKIKGGIKQEDIKDANIASIFNAIDKTDKEDGVLSQEELNHFFEIVRKEAEKHNSKNLGNKEYKNLVKTFSEKDLNLTQVSKESFLNFLFGLSKAVVSEKAPEVSQESEPVPEQKAQPAQTDDTVSQEPKPDAVPEAEPEYEEMPVEETIEEPETVCEEPVEETEEFTKEVPVIEEIAETIVEEEEPAVLTREDMGYDIVFNTTISCLITNASLTKSQANKLASILHDAYARAIKPVHGTMDGDTVFVLATGKQKVNFDAFAALATDVMQYAIIDGAMSAEGAYGLPAAKDMR